MLNQLHHFLLCKDQQIQSLFLGIILQQIRNIAIPQVHQNQILLVQQRIDSWIDKLLEENFNYSLLADIHHYKMIVLPNYELIVVKCKKEASRDDFRKNVPTIIQKEKRFVESLEVKKNG
jgi:hypothetical protein